MIDFKIITSCHVAQIQCCIVAVGMELTWLVKDQLHSYLYHVIRLLYRYTDFA